MGNLKLKYINIKFLSKRYYVDTTAKKSKGGREYIDKQLDENYLLEQLIVDKINMFMGNQG